MMEKMIAGLLAIPGLKVYGITDPRRFENRGATFAVRIEGHTPLELATKLGERGFFTWDGNYYALNLTEQLDVERLGISAHRASALQHNGGSRESAEGAKGDCGLSRRWRISRKDSRPRLSSRAKPDSAFVSSTLRRGLRGLPVLRSPVR